MFPNSDIDKKIESYLLAHKDELLSDWMKLIRIPSIRGEASENAPYGEQCAKALRFSADLFTNYGFEVKLNDKEGYALARYGNGKSLLGLFSHSDVVPAGDGWIHTSPFDPKMINGFMIGRGCDDNKSGVIASLYAMRAIKDLKLPLSCTVQAFVGSCEETGMDDIKAFVKTETMPDLSLVPDADFPCSLGEKGILRLWAECCTPLDKIIDLFGGEAFNVILDRATAVIALDKEQTAVFLNKNESNEFIQIDESEEGLRITALGIAKHAAHPDGGINAAARLSEYILSRMKLSEEEHACLETMRDYLSEFDGKALGIDHIDPDFGALSCANGMIRMQNNRVQISLDIRYGTGLDPILLEEKLRLAWEKRGWSIISIHNETGFSTPKHSRVPQIITTLCNSLSGKKHKPYRMSGGTYARYLKNAYSIGTSLTSSSDDSALKLPDGHGGVHERDEAINVDAFFRAVRLLVHAIIQCDKNL